MARKRAIFSDDGYNDDSDAAYEPAPTEKAKAKARPRAAAVKRKRVVSGIEDNAAATRDVDFTAHPALHAKSVHRISDPQPLRDALLDWYSLVHETRGMPWRKPYDPSLGPGERAQRAYEVWISEIMLQQTQVATVIPYYNKWMAKFPTIRDLAASDIDTVNSLWKGLGYYSRAARLLSGAKKAVEQFDGRLPDNAKDMEATIPGIGRYSAGAICSIAYGQCVPVLDGNVHRVLSRVLALHAPPKAKQTLDILWAAAAAMVEGTACPGDLNQALIELGATVCKVRDPACGSCPLQPWCQAYQKQTAKSEATDRARAEPESRLPDIEELCTLCEPVPAPGLVAAYPMKADKKKAREELDIVNVVEWRDRARDARWFLLVRRPEGGLLAGLHEFPTAPDVPVGLSPAAARDTAHRALAELLAEPLAAQASPAGADAVWIARVAPAGDVVHVFSHIRKTYRVQWVLLEGGGAPPPLRPAVPRPDAAKRKAAGRSKPRARADGAAEAARNVPLVAAWTPLAAVAEANIGTGVLKVWKRACALWEE
ncbi:DNA glycosylase [Obba rivulosa]|uniref:Adenine DNA glycosylase n=1 Tax=Obba rivulosa TaxID=1052685 RepID=A0A8E2DQS1_9APHY|nr:DNA glycosylase [Obba rivulosa]